MRKRQKFVVTSIVLALGFVVVKFLISGFKFEAIGGLTLLALILTVWSLKEGLAGIEWLMVPILPLFFTSGVGLFYLLLPSVWFEEFMIGLFPDGPVMLLFRFFPPTLLQTLLEVSMFGIGTYSLLLTQNIFTVAAVRTIQLFRSAHAVGFLLTLTTSFFVYDAIWSSKLPFWQNGLLVFLVTFPLALQALWSVKLDEKITRGLWSFSLTIAIILGEAALVLSFWPVAVTSGSLFLSACLYLILGLCQQYLDQRLYRKTVREYLAVWLVVLFSMYLTTQWGG